MTTTLTARYRRRKGWSRRQIRAALVRRGLHQKALASRIERSQGAVSNVIAGRRRSRYIRKAVADAIGVPVERIWPDENDAAGDPPTEAAA